MSQASAKSSVTVCTLWEGDYHKGAGALINSLYLSGFRGTVWAGYRGSLPTWAGGGVAHVYGHTVSPAQGLQIAFVKLETDEHFAHYKPIFCEKVLREYEPSATGVYYFDPDIVIVAGWSFFEEWLECGVAVCEDSHHPLNPTHPLTIRWKRFAAAHGMQTDGNADASLNSGLVGLKREHMAFLSRWQEFIYLVRTEYNFGRTELRRGNRSDLFYIPDQDTFTLTAWTAEVPISLVGVDGMGFGRGSWLVVHALAPKKPWRRTPVRDVILHAVAPDIASRLYWKFVSAPLEIEPPFRVRLHRWLISVAALVGRFYRRS